jgi:hypothetical protein
MQVRSARQKDKTKTEKLPMTYSSSLAMSRQRYAGRNQNTTSFRVQERTLGPISNTIMLVILACLLGLLYLTQVTKTNAYGYQINDLKEQQTKLKDEHAQLEIASARLQALDRVKNSDVAKNMVTVSPSETLQN